MPLDVFLMNMWFVVKVYLLEERPKFKRLDRYVDTNFKEKYIHKFLTITNAPSMSLVAVSILIRINFVKYLVKPIDR